MSRTERRSRRRARRVLGQMDRASRRHHHTSRWQGRATVLVLVAACVWVLSPAQPSLDTLEGVFRSRAYVEIDGRAVAVPRPGDSAGRLRPEVPVTTEGAHAFLHVTEAGEPVGYDPCRPVPYVVRPDGAPRSGPALIDDAVEISAAATGLELVAVGATDEAPLEDRPLIQPERYGEGWAPILIAWADEDEVPELTGQVAGVGGSAAVPGADGTGSWLAAGRLVLDGPDMAALLERSNGYEQARAIVVHELAHVLGLDHVEDAGELMHPLTSVRTDLGPGDLQGLALVGQVECEG